MTIFGDSRPEVRRNVGELDDGLRRRILALDEPVGRDDWSDVARRASMSRNWGRGGAMTLTWAAGAAVALATATAVLVLGFLYPSLGVPHRTGAAGAGQATGPASVVASAGAGTGAARQSRTIASRPSTDGSLLFVVSLTSHGGFCYRWTGGGSGCVQRLSTLGVDWRDGQVVGAVSSADVSSVTIKFTDGTAVRPAISWVAAPFNAGFFRYDIPRGKTVAEVVADDGNRTRGEALWYV